MRVNVGGRHLGRLLAGVHITGGRGHNAEANQLPLAVDGDQSERLVPGVPEDPAPRLLAILDRQPVEQIVG